MSSRRRRRNRRGEQSFLSRYGLLIGGAVLVAIVLAPVVMNLIESDEPPAILEGEVEEFDDEGQEHVDPGTQVSYETDPPTSGAHYPTWADPGFHREAIQNEYLVHNLEHGHIVIYYDPDDISSEVSDKITELTDEYTGTWDAVMAVPRSLEENELILTAWTYRLQLEEYDEEMVDAFVDAFRGKGPENPVR